MSITFHGSLSSSGPSSLSATSFGRALPRNAAESDIKVKKVASPIRFLAVDFLVFPEISERYFLHNKNRKNAK